MSHKAKPEMRITAIFLVVILSCGSLFYLPVVGQDTSGGFTNSSPKLRPQPPSAFRFGCDCYSFPDCFTNCSSVAGLLPQLRASSQFLQSLPTPFGVTRPQQVRKGRFKFDTSTANKWSYFSQAHFHLSLLDPAKPIQIKVRKSSVFTGDGEYSTLFHRNRNGVVSEVESTKLDDCFYTGEVVSAPNTSFVAVDTCSGLRGALHVGNTTFVILPLPCPACDPQTAPHIVLPWSASRIALNASMRTFWKPVDLMAMMQTSASQRLPDLTKAVHTLWLEFIVDESLLRQFRGNFTTTLRYVASVVNLVNLHFRDLPIQLHLLRTQVWNLGNRAPIVQSIKATLNNLQRYRSELSLGDKGEPRRSRRGVEDGEEGDSLASSPQDAFRQPGSRRPDISLLLTDSTEVDFVEEVDHLAISGSICTPRGTAVVRVNVTDFEFRVATLVSKSIAEILGIHSIPCPQMYSCDENMVFSRGDVSRLRLALLSGMSACLRSTDLQERESLRVDSCGNGVIDRGEECEPLQQGLPIGLPPTPEGSFNLSLNSPAFGCCDAKTCLADVHAVCVEGGCCRNCQLVARGRLCRPARDQCDLPEFCSGMEPECPGDLYLENGMPCKGGKDNNVEEEALCYEGRCPTRSSHCKALWGPDAQTGNEYCYNTMNRNIDSACGDGVVCEEENTMCGLLHCQNGSDEPIPVEARSLSFFNLRTQHENRKIQCQYVASTQKFSYVPEGASCNDGRFCFQKRCIKPTAVAVHSKCPKGLFPAAQDLSNEAADFIHPAVRRNLPTGSATPVNVTCSGRGICTNGAFCLCPPGWHGPACSHHQPPANQTASTAKLRTKASHISVYPDEDISGLIWMYLQAIDKSPEGLTPPAQVNTVYLISILAAVVACVFFSLCGVIFLYRRRNLNNRGFRYGSKRKRCLSSPGSRLSPPLFDSSLGKSSANTTATTTAANSMDSMCLCNRNSRPGGASLDDMELHYKSRHSSRSHRHRHTSASSSSKNRNRRRKRGGGGGGGGGVSSGDSLQAGANGTIESGPELGRNGDDSVKDESGSAGGKIKFGSMPSYREDKMKHARETTAPTAVANTPPTPAVSDAVVTTTTATANVLLQQRQPPLIDFSSPWPLPPPPPPLPFLGPAVCAAVATANSMFVGTSSPWMSTPQTPLATNGSVNTPPLSGNTLSLDGGGVELGAMSVQSARKVMSTSAISTEEADAGTSQVTVIRENSCRQPEKGILKNKHEGGGGMEMADVSSATEATSGSRKRKRSSKRSGKKHRCSSSHFPGSASSTSSSSSTSSTTGSRSPSASSSGLSSSSISSVSSCSTSRATDDTNSTNFVTSGTNSGEEEEEGEGGLMDVVSDSGSTCSTALEAGDADRRANARKCRHKMHRHRKRQCKRKPGHCQHGRGHGHGHHHHHHNHGHHRRRRQSSSNGGDTSATTTSTPRTTATTSNSSSTSTSSPCHRRCHRRRRTGAGRRCRLSSEDAESSIGAQSHKVPTILCNAEQQTDEISLARAAGAIHPAAQTDPQCPSPSKEYPPASSSSSSLQLKQQSTQETIEEEDSEWEEVECTGGSDCEECRKNAAASPWNAAAAVPPTPPSAGGLLSRQYKLPSPPPLPPAVVTSAPYYCTAQLSSQAEIDPYYQPPMEDADSLVGEKTALVGHRKYPGHAEEDDGLISNRGAQAALPLSSALNAPGDCYMMKDSDGLTRKKSAGVPYIARHNYNGSDSDFSLSNSVKKSPTPGHPSDWLSSSGAAQVGGADSHAATATAAGTHQWLDVAESDASSLPDASCDLVHLAQLSHAARINPNLYDLARQQERIRLGAEAPFYPKQP